MKNNVNISKNLFKFLGLSSLAIIAMTSCDFNYNKSGNTKIYLCKDGQAVDSGSSIDVRFYSVANLPYVNVKDYLNVFVGDVYDVTYQKSVFTFTNKIWKNKGSQYKPNATFNINTNTITYDDYTCFVCVDSVANTPIDLVSGKNVKFEYEEGKPRNLFLGDIEGEYIAGDSVSINIKDTYNIECRYEDENLYLPLYTAKSLFTSNRVSSFFYNGKALYQTNSDISDAYKNIVKRNLFTPTADYLEYAYNQFALDLDLHYGMGGITRKMRSDSMKGHTYHTGLNDSSYSILSGYKSKLIKSAKDFNTASETIFANDLDDGGHTGLLGRNYYSTDAKFTRGSEYIYDSKSQDNILNTRGDKEEHKKGDSYVMLSSDKKTVTMRLEEFNELGVTRVIDLCRTVNQYNTINHIIIDLSCNGGGYIFLQHYLSLYLSNGTSKNYAVNSINNSKGYVKYNADVNLDGVIDDKDKLPTDRENFTVDIICSNFTFSAANATACYAMKYKPDGMTFNICGENSGGGVCAVDSTMMDVFGGIAQYSSPYRLAYEDYTYVDDGVAPESTSQYKWDSHSLIGAKNYSSYYLGY